MVFPVLVSFCILVGGWSFLSVLGNERQRKLQERAAIKAAQAASETPVARHVAR